MELGPPYTEYRRPRDFYPPDGVKVWQSTFSPLDSGKDEWEVARHGTDQPVPEGWGGWHDAGDWNPRRMTHLRNNVDYLLELLLMQPDYFGKLTWPLPQDHAVPSILNEILWETECFRRLQLPNGACRFGLETDGDPRDGEVSWRQTMDVCAYAPDPWAGFIYTSIAARLACVLRRYDPSLAQTYRDSALKAMAWSEAEWPKVKDKPEVKKHWEVLDDRNFAALELYRLTGDKHWHDVFLEDTVLTAGHPELNSWGRHIQLHQAFGYCLLPDNLADPKLKAKARAATLELASRALNYAKGNAFGLTCSDFGRPLFAFFFSVPLAADLVRAHYLTHEPQYLAGIVQACLFPGGANPENTTFTVGVGSDWPHNPLKVDARLSGQPTPMGQTVFGPFDFHHRSDSWLTWPMNDLLSKLNTPGPYDWPVPEAFYDIWIFVGQDEYTVEGFGQNAYVWGYLASRH
jgi:endoglucanase